MPRLPPRAELTWAESGAPRAGGDVYYSNAGGLAESEAVFLAGCDLPQAWRGEDRFAVCELGFGTGLNIIAAWRAWKKTRSPHAILHISSIEAFPLERTEAARALAQFPEITDLAARLVECWPLRAYAPQRIWLGEDNFSLTLHIGEAETILAGMHARFDAWFLDGFAPSRNPAMWSEAVLAQIARLSAPGARLATFTVASHVRRGLEAVGFAVEKKPGFAAKRERLQARFGAASPPPPTGRSAAGESPSGGIALRSRSGEGVGGEGRENAPAPDVLARPSPAKLRLAPSPQGKGFERPYPYAACHPKRVAIIGAGIAGAACAWALSRRGVETIVLETGPALGSGASGNPAGIVMPRLDRGGVLREFFLAAFLYAERAYEALGAFESRGVEERAQSRTAAALADLIADPPLPADWFGPAGERAVLHACAGLIRPLAAIERMLAGATLLYEAPVAALERAGEGWVLRAPDGSARLRADAVVLACGAALAQFEPARFLPLQMSRGQIEWGEGSAPLRAIVQGSYAAPHAGGVLFGATFDKPALPESPPGNDAAVLDARARNLAALFQLAPDLAASIDPTKLSSRAALRASTPDFAPVAGLLPDAQAWRALYAGLTQGRSVKTSAPPPAHAGLYVLGGLGARGLTMAPVLGERIAAEMLGEPQMLSSPVLDALHPARFLYRALRRPG